MTLIGNVGAAGGKSNRLRHSSREGKRREENRVTYSLNERKERNIRPQDSVSARAEDF